jgi:serine/threonine-protein kinase HipA
MDVGREGAASSLENALTELSEFGLKRARAIELVQLVARVVDGWEAHFAALGVSAADRELIKASIDRDALRLQRRAYR